MKKIIIAFLFMTFLFGIIFAKGIEFGPESIFRDEQTSNFATAKLDSTHFIAVYGNSYNLGAVKIGTVTQEDSVTYGTETIFSSRNISSCSVALLDQSHFVIASGSGRAIIGHISGGSVSFGSEKIFNENQTGACSVTKLTSSRFVVAFQDVGNSDFGTAIVGSVSGTNISFGDKFIFNVASTYYCSISALNSSNFIIAYEDGGNSNYGTVIEGIASGNSITFQPEFVFNTDVTQFCSVISIDDSYFVVAFENIGAVAAGTAIVGNVNAASISFGAKYIFNQAQTNDISASLLDSRYFAVSYSDFNNGQKGTSCIGKISGKSISFGGEYVFCEETTHHCAVAALRTTNFVTIYSNSGNGCAVIGEVVGNDPTPVILNVFTIDFILNTPLLQWTTLSENGNLGWNIYRSEKADFQNSLQINSELITGAGTTSEPTNYSFTDENSVLENITYFYWLESRNLDGTTEIYGPVSLTIPKPEDENPENPNTDAMNFLKIFPNPVSSGTSIEFSLVAADECFLNIYNLKGELIRKLAAGNFSQGIHQIYWDGTNNKNKSVSSGIYLAKLKSKKLKKVFIRKMIKLR